MGDAHDLTAQLRSATERRNAQLKAAQEARDLVAQDKDAEKALRESAPRGAQ